MSLPPKEIPLGAMRFNSDFQKLEYWNGEKWFQIHTFNPDLDGGARGVFTGGQTPTNVNVIDYVTITTAGDAIDFGDLTQLLIAHGACADKTRGVMGGGQVPGAMTNVIDFVTISSTGDSQDFGDMTVARSYLAACNNATRGVFGGAWSPARLNTIDYVTIQSTGNAQDFGDLLTAKQTDGSFSSPTRSFWVGGASGSGPAYDPTTSGTVINFITTSSTGDAQDFGDLINGTFGKVGASNSTRGLAAGGYGSPAYILAIEFITMATVGNSTNFGDMTIAHYYASGTSNQTRAIFAGGVSPAMSTIDYVNIATEGDAVDFGDLTSARQLPKGMSNANGGLG